MSFSFRDKPYLYVSYDEILGEPYENLGMLANERICSGFLHEEQCSDYNVAFVKSIYNDSSFRNIYFFIGVNQVSLNTFVDIHVETGGKHKNQRIICMRNSKESLL